LQALQAKHVLPALSDKEPRVREHALRLAERFQSDIAIRAQMQKMVKDDDLRVRYQLAFSLGAVEGDMPAKVLHQLAVNDGSDPWVRLAILTSAHGRRGELFQALTSDDKLRRAAGGKLLANALAVQIGAANQPNELAGFLKALDHVKAAEARELMAS